MQFSSIHTQSGVMQSVLKFQGQDQWNSISLVPEKLDIRLNPTDGLGREHRCTELPGTHIREK